MQEIYELSNSYYEIVPTKHTTGHMPQPIKTLGEVGRLFDMLNNLEYISHMSKIYLGALSKQTKMNPLDYIHKIFNTEFKVLDQSALEYKMLHEYIDNTWSQRGGGMYVANIFSVNKKGESEAMAEHRDLTNQKLLFHGSSTENFVGVFYQGM